MPIRHQPVENTTARSTRGRTLPLLALLFAAALVPRLVYLAELQRSPLEDFLSLDTRTHHLMGLRIAETGTTGEDVFFRAPLYPYAVGLLYRLCGPDRFAVRLAQALLGALAAPLTFLLGLRLLGRAGALAAALLAAGSWVMVYFGGELLIATILIPLDLLLLLLLTRCGPDRRPGKGILFAAGLLLGLSALARPNILIFLPAVAFWLGWLVVAREGKPLLSRTFLFSLLALVLGTVLMVAPVTLRNMVRGGDPVLVASQGGINFFLGNNASANGRAAIAPCNWAEIPAAFRQRHAHRIWAHELIWISGKYLAEKETGRGDLKPSEVSSFWFRKAGAFIAGHPVQAAGLLARKAFYLLNAYEIPSNKDMAHFIRHNRLGTLNLLSLSLPGRFPSGLLLPLALLGLGFALADWRRHLLFLLFLASYSAGIILFFVNARYRVPMLPLVMIYAVLGVGELARRWRATPAHGRLKRLALPLIALALLGLFCNANLFQVRDPILLGTLHFNLGNHHLNQKDFDLAEASYGESLRLNPGLVDAHSNLGNLCLQRRAFEEAAGHFAAAARLSPENPAVHYQLGETQSRLGRLSEAAASLQEALRLDPRMWQAAYQLGNAEARRKNSQAALRAYGRALSLKPDHVPSRFNLGVLLLESGDLDGALRELNETVRLDPGLAEAHFRLAEVHFRRGEGQAMARELHEVLRLEPGNANARRMLDRLQEKR
jgi:tetratricopeptide (TPR) repeat protein